MSETVENKPAETVAPVAETTEAAPAPVVEETKAPVSNASLSYSNPLY